MKKYLILLGLINLSMLFGLQPGRQLTVREYMERHQIGNELTWREIDGRQRAKYNLSGKGITSLEGLGHYFGAVQDLIEIDLSGNHITELGTVFQHGFVHLRTLNLKRNEITHIDDNTFSLPNLQRLSLSVNRLVNVSPQAFNFLPQLQFLGIHHNRLSGTKETFRQQHNLGQNVVIRWGRQNPPGVLVKSAVKRGR